MSDTKATPPLDKGKRLASIMSMGFGYFKAKEALEEHDWNVDDAAASLQAKYGKPIAKDDESKELEKVTATSSWTALKDDKQESPDPIGTKFLKDSTLEKSSLKPHARVTATTLSAATLKKDDGGPQLSPVSVADTQSLRQDAAALKVQKHDGDDNDDPFPYLPDHEDMDGTSESARAPRPFPRARLEEHSDFDVVRAAPGAFREGYGRDDEDTATALDSLSYSRTTGLDSLSYSQTTGTAQDSTSAEEPYMAVAQVVTEPELVKATPQEPDHAPPEAASGSADDMTTPKEEGWTRGHRNLYALLIVALLLVIGLAVGLGISQKPHGQDTGQAPTVDNTTSSPTVAPPPDVTGPTLASTTPPSPSQTTQLPSATYPTVGSPTRVEGARMVLTGASVLDVNAQSSWAEVTVKFIDAEVGRVLQAQSSSYSHKTDISVDSQTTDANNNLEVTFSVDFVITSSLPPQDAGSYVMGAFDTDAKRSAYIAELKATGDSSFQGVSDVSVAL